MLPCSNLSKTTSRQFVQYNFPRGTFVVTKREFASVFKGPFERAFSVANIKASFTKTGIYLFNPHAIDSAKMKPSEFYNPTSSVASRNSSSNSTAATESTILAPHTPSPVVSSLDCLELNSSGSLSSSGSSNVPPHAPTSTSTVPNTPTPLILTPPQGTSTPDSSTLCNQ